MSEMKEKRRQEKTMNDLVTQSPMQLMQLAIENKSAAEVMKDLMDLQDRHEAKQARIAFQGAMKDFQAACPSMKRTKELKHGNNVICRYAPLSEISKTIQPCLEECDLTKIYEFETTKDEIRVGCKITHVQGHTETTWLSGPAEDSGVKNPLQARASTITYLQRYTTIGALGITTADDDDDGKSSGEPVAQKMRVHNDAVRDNFSSIFFIKEALKEEDYDRAAECLAEIDKPIRDILKLAPTKGGCFTTAELKQFSTSEFRAAWHIHHPEAIGPPDDGTDGTLGR